MRQVFPRRSSTGLSPARHGLGAALVGTNRETSTERFEVGATFVSVVLAHAVRCLVFRRGLLELEKPLALRDSRPRPHGDGSNHARAIGCDDVLHLHRFEDDERLPFLYDIAFMNGEPSYEALHGRHDRVHRARV